MYDALFGRGECHSYQLRIGLYLRTLERLANTLTDHSKRFLTYVV